ncbi:Eukaryotic translation initiation factor 4 gamma, partial [Trametes pubescens]
MAVCKEKPDSLPPLDAIGLEPTDQSLAMPPHGDSQHGHNRRPSSSAMPPPSSNVSRQASVGLGISGFQKNVNPFTMGQFSTPKMSSEERFAASSRSTSVSNSPPRLPFGRPAPVVRSPSQGGPSSSGSTRSQRGGKRDKERPDAGHSRQGNAFGSSLANSMSLEPVAPPEVVDRKVRSLLNELTMERFDSISDQTIAWVNNSQNEKDAQTLLQFIQVVFEKATADEAWSKICARLCRKMMEQISPNIRDDGIKNADGKPMAGGQLFRKYLFNRCQDDFERGWVAKEDTAAAAATKATEDEAAKAAAEGEEDEENALYSEYYAAQKAKRQGLGLIKFIGELFKLQMLTERIMHECVKKLLGNVENPVEEEIESLCKLLTTVGQILDTPKARAHMDVYFSRMKELCKSPNVNSRMQFMLQDVIELRERKWIPRNLAAAPTTIAALREQIEREKAASDNDAMNRALSMSRGGLRRGGDCNDHQQIGPDGWVAVAGGPAPRQPPKVNTRVQLMLQDVIELRERRWVPHDPIVTASDEPTIATLYEQMNKMRAMREQNLSNRRTRTLHVSRGLHQQIGLDGWAVGGGPAPRQPPKAGDLSNFGKINKSTPMTFGYSSVSQKDKTKSRESTLSRQGSTDMFSMLSAKVNPEIAAEVMSAKSSCPPSRKGSVDLGPGGAPEATPQRKRLQLLPRSVPVDSKSESTPASSAAGSDDEGAESTGGPSMSVEEANTRIAEDLKEFFSIRDLNEADVYFTKLPAEHRHLLVNKLVTRAIESKEADAQLVADLLDRAHSKNLVSPAS